MLLYYLIVATAGLVVISHDYHMAGSYSPLLADDYHHIIITNDDQRLGFTNKSILRQVNLSSRLTYCLHTKVSKITLKIALQLLD